MNIITKTLFKWTIPGMLLKKSPAMIPRSGVEGEKVNCYTVSLYNNGPYMLVNMLKGDNLFGLVWNGNQYTIEKSLPISTLTDFTLEITHYYGLTTITYNSIYDFIFHNITRWIYIKVRVHRLIESMDQYYYNKKKLVTKQRLDLLKFMMSDQLDRKEEGVTSFELMKKLYSIKWVLHPERDRYKKELELYLDSLIKSGDLEYKDRKHFVTGKAISTIEKDEEEERRHVGIVKIQRKMFWLTVIIVILTLFQTGIIKLPVLWDLSK